MGLGDQYRIAAVVPCFNEELAVGRVVEDLLAAVPGIVVYVYDNASTDGTSEVAEAAGAVVRQEPLKGKGNAVRRAFADIDADIYLLIDGDDTYDAFAAPEMIQTLVGENLDHVLGVRREIEDSGAYRPAHEAGNKVLNGIVTSLFGDTLGDMLSGYRVFSRRFVKSFPAASQEFEIETELTVHSLALRIPTAKVDVDFKDRPVGSESKLRTVRDGFKILGVIARLTRHERPISYFGALSGIAALLTVLVSGIAQWRAGAVHGLAAGLTVAGVILTVLLLVAGFILDAIRKSRHESGRANYMRYEAVRDTARSRVPSVPTQRRFGRRVRDDEVELVELLDEPRDNARAV